jgi:GAF domain-containing protein
MPSPDVLDEERLRRLIDAGRSLVSELDLESLLRRVLETAAEVTGARYAAVGILDEHRAELERFLRASDPRHVMRSGISRAAAASSAS